MTIFLVNLSNMLIIFYFELNKYFIWHSQAPVCVYFQQP